MSDPAPEPTRPAFNPWLIAAAVTIPTFMEVLDTSIANVALRYIAGGLSAASVDSEWVITTYLASNAIILPISGWLAGRLGRRRYFLMSMAGFTAASGLCGMATSLPELICFRILQGISGGGLQPCTQGVLLDSFPPEKQGSAMTMFGVATLIAPILGPTLGGWITDNYSWRYIFIINVPVGLLALAACYVLVDDPPYLKQKRAELAGKPLNFDFAGLGLIAVGIASLEVLLSKGQEWDWLGDPTGRVRWLIVGIAIGLGGAVWWESRARNPVVDLRPLLNRNFLLCGVAIFSCYGVLYGSSTTLPAMLQTLFGYDATHAGLVLSPAGLFAIMMLPVVGAMLGRQVDARWLIVAGASLMAGGSYWLSQLNLEIAPIQVVWPRVVQITGLSMIFAPLNVAAYMYLGRDQRAAAVGLFSLLRNEGGSVGTSLANTVLARREQFHALRLNEGLDPFNPILAETVEGLRAYQYSQTGDPVGSRMRAWQMIDDIRQQQGLSLSYFDCFWLFAVLALALIPLALLMRRSVAEKGAHVAAE